MARKQKTHINKYKTDTDSGTASLGVERDYNFKGKSGNGSATLNSNNMPNR